MSAPQIPPPPFRCARDGCPEPVTSWARDDFGGYCSEGCRDLIEHAPEDPYVCRKCGEADPRTVERGETSAPVRIAVASDGMMYAAEYPEGVGDSSTDWQTIGVCCGSCSAECLEGDGIGEAPTIGKCFERVFVLRSKRAPEVAP